MTLLHKQLQLLQIDVITTSLLLRSLPAQHRSLPGVMMGDLAAKNDRVFLVHAVAFSGDSRSFAVATSHGLYIYSIDLQVEWAAHRHTLCKIQQDSLEGRPVYNVFAAHSMLFCICKILLC